MKSTLVVVMSACLLTLDRPSALASPAVSWDAIRPQSAGAERLLSRALERSATVRALASRIAESDVIVYVELRHDLPPGMAACLTWMSTTDSRRFVRVSIRQGLRPADRVAFAAHELRHVVEVIDHPEVRSAADLDDLYRRIGDKGAPTRAHWDTLDAVAAERVARMEAQTGRPTTTRRSG